MFTEEHKTGIQEVVPKKLYYMMQLQIILAIRNALYDVDLNKNLLSIGHRGDDRTTEGIQTLTNSP